MGRDWTNERIAIDPNASKALGEFIRDWMQEFHDNYRAETTATQWALYDFIRCLNEKVGIGVCPCCGKEQEEGKV